MKQTSSSLLPNAKQLTKNAPWPIHFAWTIILKYELLINKYEGKQCIDNQPVFKDCQFAVYLLWLVIVVIHFLEWNNVISLQYIPVTHIFCSNT